MKAYVVHLSPSLSIDLSQVARIERKSKRTKNGRIDYIVIYFLRGGFVVTELKPM